MGHRSVAVALGIVAALMAPETAAAVSVPAPQRPHERVCSVPWPGEAACLAEVVTDRAGRPDAATAPSGYGPADLQRAYGLTGASATAGGGQTIAIVDAYDAPSAEADLAVYRSAYGLPPCSAASGCLRKVGQDGGTSLPAADASWAQEISLDLDMASAICPHCRLLLVEARSAAFSDLATAVDTAAALGATTISNSYGGGEFRQQTASLYSSPYDQPGIPITVASGDGGYGAGFPASAATVTAVGGTTLRRSGRGFTQSAWAGAGSGCSAYVAKPSWQHDTACPRRTVADVSAVADPSTGVAVYDSTPLEGQSGWMVFGGTSVAAPIVAGVYALAGNGAGIRDASYVYAHPTGLLDVTSGANGVCGGSYLCTAGAGFDGPTGLGTPSGVGGF